MGAPSVNVDTARKNIRYNPDTGSFIRTGVSGERKLRLRENAKGYHRIDLKGRRYFAHRLAWYLHYGEWPDAIIDHVNGNRQDNRISNLRIVDQSQNSINCKVYASNSTGFKGVSERSPGVFRARIQKGGKTVSLGDFPTADDAHLAYLSAAESLHGEYRRLPMEAKP